MRKIRNSQNCKAQSAFTLIPNFPRRSPTSNMADSVTTAVASQVPFYDFCSLLEKISGTSGTEKKKKILTTFLNSWREAHGKLHGSSKTVEYFLCSDP